MLKPTHLKDDGEAAYSAGLLEDFQFSDTLPYGLGVGVVCLGYLKPKDIGLLLKKCQKNCQRLLFFESVGAMFLAKTGYTTRPLDFYKSAFKKANWNCYSYKEVTFPPDADGHYDPMCAFALHFKEYSK